jgi:hypothetical protein
MFIWLIVPLLAIDLTALPERSGTLEGLVVNGSRGDEPVGGAEILLRAGHDNHLQEVDRGKTDSAGRFYFHVPCDSTLTLLVGADRDGIHYPGNRVQVDERYSHQHVLVRVFDAVQAPSPLRATRHDIELSITQDLMTVSETLVIQNDSTKSYVGEHVGSDRPVTLRLRIPPNFDRVTFAKEFYGRRFRIVDHELLTDIPWPPGKRELRLTYHLPLKGDAGRFQRALDMPCQEFTIRVRGTDLDRLSCDLPLKHKAGNEAVFAAAAGQLIAGDTVTVQIGDVRPPWSLFARWGSVGVLSALILASTLAGRLRARSKSRSHPHIAAVNQQKLAATRRRRFANVRSERGTGTICSEDCAN